jgi:hypothetical protein
MPLKEIFFLNLFEILPVLWYDISSWRVPQLGLTNNTSRLR